MKRICWFSRHRPLECQKEALKKMFGSEVQIVQDPQPFSSAEEISKRYRAGNFDDMVIVAPLSVLAKLVELGIKPLWCQMDVTESRQESDLTYNGRHYKFNRFRRVKMVHVEFED
ncbi:MAG: hypothetical protein NUV82_01295 [Candidatus Komeilibacteria bacterium]|nr:hypothetical protein [Candidatus Komeilibacteria bacterium]